jgi:hypothetical protein
MANTVRIKRRASGASGAPSSLANAELAFNEVDNVLYYGKGTGGAGGTATTIEAIGGNGAFVGLTGTQTITGAKTFSGTVALGSSATATTQTTGNNTTSVATTAFVQAALSGSGLGTVTSVALTAPSFISVSGSPITGAGTIALSLASQTANQVFAAPNGSNGTPTFRSLVAADIPSLTSTYLGLSAGGTVSGATTFSGTVALGSSATATTPSSVDNSTKVATTAYVQNQGFLTSAVSSVGLALPTSVFSVTNSPVTVSGTLTGSFVSQTANHVFAAPNGSAGTPTFRALVASDIPSLSYLPTSGGTVSGNLTVTGDLTINGTTTNINSTNLVVEDKNIVLGDVASPSDVTADGGGITLKGATDKTFNWVDSTDAWTSSEHLNLAAGKSYYIGGTLVLSSKNLDNVTVDGGTF